MSAVAPQDLDAEESLLGAVLASAKAIDAVVDEVQPADFYRASNGAIYAAALALYGRGEPADPITVTAELEQAGKLDDVGGRMRVNELAALVSMTSNAAHYARIVREHAVRRGLLRASGEIARIVRDRDGADSTAMLDRSEELIFDLARQRHRGALVAVADLVMPVIEQLSGLQGGSGLSGLSSGLIDLDRMTAGFQPGNLIVVGARPSMGKSALALGVASYTAAHGNRPVALFTMEMTDEEVTQRLLALEGGVDLHAMRSGKLSVDEWSKVYAVGELVQAAPLYIDDAGAPTVLEIRSKCRQLQARHRDLALVVVDYLQLVTQEAETRLQEVSKISRGLKMLAGDLRVPILALSQLSRQVEQRHDKRPMLSDLRETGQLEADADLALMLYRDEVYNAVDAIVDGTAGTAELNVAKQRNGPTGVVKLAFEKRWARFGNLARERD